MMKPIFAALLFVTFTSPAFAEGFAFPQKDDLFKVNSQVMPLHESTPAPSLGEKATQTGLIRRGEIVKILETKQYISMFGNELWVSVVKQSDPSVKGWAFAGTIAEIRQGHSRLVSTHPKMERSEAGEEIFNAPSPASVPAASADED